MKDSTIAILLGVVCFVGTSFSLYFAFRMLEIIMTK